MAKSRKEVDRVIAEIEAQIEGLTATKNMLVAAKTRAQHATAPKATRKPRAVPALREPA